MMKSHSVSCLVVIVITLMMSVLSSTSSSSFMINALDLVDITSVEEYEKVVLGETYHAALVYFYANWDKENMHLKKTFQQAADQMTHDHVSGLVMGMVDVGRHPKIAKAVGVNGLPVLLLYQYGIGARRWSGSYHSDGFTVEKIIEFAVAESSIHREKLDKIRDAQVEKERTHYDFPHPSPGKIVELDPANFDRVVRDPTKVAFVMFYADWCEICKETMPHVERLAQYYETSGRIVIARLDVEANQEWVHQTGLELEGVPTFILYPRGRKDKELGFHYIGEREFEDMTVYVNTHNKKAEEDMEEFHRSVIRNKPDDKELPEDMQGARVSEHEHAVSDDLFDKDGRPYGNQPENKQPMNALREGKDGRTISGIKPRYDGHHHKLKAQKEEDLIDSMTPEEAEIYRLKKQKQKYRVDSGANPMGSGGLPPEMKGKI